MNELTDLGVKRFVLALSVQAEVEGMKAENRSNESAGHEPAHTEEDFIAKSDRLMIIACACEEHLQTFY